MCKSVRHSRLRGSPLRSPLRSPRLLAVTGAATLLLGQAIAAEAPGVLDQIIELSPAAAPVQIERLQEAVQVEQEVLETLERDELETRAESGERAAQVALGADFAKEATLLGFAPAAANDALADAVRWYSLAASRGFPGAPSLDQAGIRFYPIRIQREQRPGRGS